MVLSVDRATRLHLRAAYRQKPDDQELDINLVYPTYTVLHVSIGILMINDIIDVHIASPIEGYYINKEEKEDLLDLFLRLIYPACNK